MQMYFTCKQTKFKAVDKDFTSISYSNHLVNFLVSYYYK